MTSDANRDADMRHASRAVVGPGGGAGADALLRLQQVGHAFGGFRVLADVSFEIPRGGLVGLIGPNGSGKTTLFNIVSGFLHPLAGSVQFRGTDLGRSSVRARSLQGLVRTFQTPKVFEHLTVLENVMAGLYKTTRRGIVSAMLRTRAARAEMQSIRERAASTCARFGLAALQDRVGANLTAGQRRNVELARACVSEPSLLMLDEPSSGLSAEEIGDLRARLDELNRGGLTILLVSHDMELMTVAQRVHVLSSGEIIASGSMQQVQADPRVQQVYLGH